MKFKSAVYTQASGSVGGLVYSHNKGGMYTRARRTPVNPSSAQQVVVRNAMALLTNSWSATLTQAQRNAWGVYATNVPLIGPTGDARQVSGLAMYLRSNISRIQTGLTQVAAAPTTFTLGTFTNPTITATFASQNLSIVFTNTDDWATAVGGAMLVYASRPQSAGINFLDGPYRYAGKIAGAVTPPTSPATIAVPFPVAVGQKVFYQVVVSRLDGRLSAPFRGQLTVT